MIFNSTFKWACLVFRTSVHDSQRVCIWLVAIVTQLK